MPDVGVGEAPAGGHAGDEEFTKVGETGEEEGAVAVDDVEGDDVARPYSPILSPMAALHLISKEGIGKLA